MTQPPVSDTYRFGLFELNRATYELKKAGRVIPLRPQPAKVLGYLVAHAGDLVLRQDLRRHIWGETFIDAEAGLNACVRDIRAVLGDRASAPTYIETVPRRGYRFIAPVESPVAAPESSGEIETQVVPDVENRAAPRERIWLLVAAVTIFLGAVVLILTWLWNSHDYREVESSTEAPSIIQLLPEVDPEAHEAILEARYLLDRGEQGDADFSIFISF